MKKSLSYLVMAGIAAGCFLTAPIACTKSESAKASQSSHKVVKHVETLQQLEDLIANNERVAVDFRTTWCGPCRSIVPSSRRCCRSYAPIFEAVAEKYGGKVVFYSALLDNPKTKERITKEGERIAKKYDIRSVPRTILFKGGKEVYKAGYLMDEKELSSLIEKYLLGSEY